MKNSAARKRLKLPAVSGRPVEGLVAAENQAKRIRKLLGQLQSENRETTRLEAISQMKHQAELAEKLASSGMLRPQAEAAEIEEMLDRLLWDLANKLEMFCGCELGCPE